VIEIYFMSIKKRSTKKTARKGGFFAANLWKNNVNICQKKGLFWAFFAFFDENPESQ